MLSVVRTPEPPKRGRGRPPLTPEQREERRKAKEAPESPQRPVNSVDEVKAAFIDGSRPAAIAGLLLGSLVPLATYTVIHSEVGTRPWLWVLAGGGLIYSAISVFVWAERAFRYRVKALGFVVLLEGTLALSKVLWLSLTVLAVLMALNGASAAVVLQESEDE